MKTILVTISPTGDTRLETRGFAGGECRDADAFLRHTLGVPLQEERTAEFYTPATLDQTTQIRS